MKIIHPTICRPRIIFLTVQVIAIICGLLGTSQTSSAQAVALGAAQSFTILGGSTVTNTGPTVINGNLGLSPGSAVTGFPPGVVLGGSIRINDALATQAHADAQTAFTQLAGELPTQNLTGTNLGGLTLNPGVYRFNTSAQLTGTLRLDTGGVADAPFHFQIGSTLTTAANSSVVLLNGNSSNVFWEVGSSAILGTNTSFYGTIIADQSISFNTGASVLNGRGLAINGAVTLDTNNISGPAAALATGRFWNGSMSNLWSGANWSPDASGATTSTLAPGADVVFSVTGVPPQNQNTILDFPATISSLTINDPTPVTISGPNLLSINGAGATTGITINPGAGLTTINSPLNLVGSSQAITVDNAAGLVINGTVAGTNGLTKAGISQLTLNGANTYTGLTMITAGALEVNGSIAGSTLVSGGILRGVGTIGGNVMNNAVVNPGRAGSPGILQIGGNYSQSSPGALNIRLASPSSYDRLSIGGGAVLDGALNVTSLNGFNARPGDVFTIITSAGGVSGRFASFNDANATGTLLTLGVVYETNQVLLEFTQGSFAGLSSSFSLTPNERAVAEALDQLAVRSPDNRLIRELDTFQLSSLPRALSLLSPEDLAAIFTGGLAVAQVQVGNIERRLEEVRQGVTGFSDFRFAATDSHGAQNYESKGSVTLDGKGGRDGKGNKELIETVVEREKRWGFFISGTGEFGDLETTNSSRGSSFTTGGVTVGADYRVSSHFVVGAAIGYANTSSDLSSGGDLDIDNGKLSLYGTLFDQGFYLNGIVGVGYGSYDTKRRTVGGFARGETEGTDFNALLGTGYDHHIGAFLVGPVASLQYSTVGIDSFSERGALGSLRINSQSQDSLKSSVGLKASYTTKLGRVFLRPEIRAQWEHEYLADRSDIDAAFNSANSFIARGPEIGRDGFLLEAGASAQLTSDVAIFAYYVNELGRGNYSVQSITGGVRIGF